MYIFIVIICAFIINFQVDYIDDIEFFSRESNLSVHNEEIRKLKIDAGVQQVKDAANELGCSTGELICTAMLKNEYSVNESSLRTINKKDFVRYTNKLKRFNGENFRDVSILYDGLVSDVKYFPVPKSTKGTAWVEYVDSWGFDRGYRGDAGSDRVHEGTDIMCINNVEGLYPVVSVCNGTVTKKGWLELGGYRIGITSENKIYYYYAHLSSYAQGLEVGDTVKAGQLLGFCGSTGYSKIEGTKGKFPVHLHFGIYYVAGDYELSLNPYFILKNLENKLLYYLY